MPCTQSSSCFESLPGLDIVLFPHSQPTDIDRSFLYCLSSRSRSGKCFFRTTRKTLLLVTETGLGKDFSLNFFSYVYALRSTRKSFYTLSCPRFYAQKYSFFFAHFSCSKTQPPSCLYFSAIWFTLPLSPTKLAFPTHFSEFIRTTFCGQL